MSYDSLIQALEVVLQEEYELLAHLTRDQYRAPSTGHYKSSIGMHIRHNLDHFIAFFEGLPAGRVDYESRKRDAGIEVSRDAAKDEIRKCLRRLSSLREQEDLSLAVREESDSGAKELRWLPSSVGRELQFLLGHTVHHHALIAMILNGQGLDLPEAFGVAPSTQRHSQRVAGQYD